MTTVDQRSEEAVVAQGKGLKKRKRLEELVLPERTVRQELPPEVNFCNLTTGSRSEGKTSPCDSYQELIAAVSFP